MERTQQLGSTCIASSPLLRARAQRGNGSLRLCLERAAALVPAHRAPDRRAQQAACESRPQATARALTADATVATRSRPSPGTCRAASPQSSCCAHRLWAVASSSAQYMSSCQRAAPISLLGALHLKVSSRACG
jgi:hypothetical protein